MKWIILIASVVLTACGAQYQTGNVKVEKIAVIGPWVYGVQGQLDGAGTYRTMITAGGQNRIAKEFEFSLLRTRHETEAAFGEIYMIADSDIFLKYPELLEMSGACAPRIDCPANENGELLGNFGRNTAGAQAAVLPKDKVQAIAELLDVDGVLVVSSRWLAGGRFGRRAHAVTISRLYDREGNHVFVAEAEAYGGVVGGWKIVNFDEDTIGHWANAHALAMERTVTKFKVAKND